MTFDQYMNRQQTARVIWNRGTDQQHRDILELYAGVDNKRISGHSRAKTIEKMEYLIGCDYDSVISHYFIYDNIFHRSIACVITKYLVF